MGLLRRWVARQFTTRVIVLMPVGIAINIVLGSTVQQALKLPIYLDSIGTILVGVLAGPLAGGLTGVLANLIWGYLLPAPIGTTTIGPFAITAGVIGLLAGFWGQLGVFRPRRGGRASVLAAAVAAVLVGALALYTYARAYASPDAFVNITGFGATDFDRSRIFFLAVMVLYVALVGTALYLLERAGFIQRDENVTNVFQARLLVRDLAEAEAKMASLHLSATERSLWTAILRELINARSTDSLTVEQLALLPEFTAYSRAGALSGPGALPPAGPPRSFCPRSTFATWSPAGRAWPPSTSWTSRRRA